MVGHKGRAEGREYFIGTEEGPEEVSEVLEAAKYFEGEEGQYQASGIFLDVTDDGIEYDITQEADDKVVQEFVEGVVRSFNGGGDEEFRSRKEYEIRETVADVDHESSYEDVQNAMERGPKEDPDRIADGGITDIPIGGGTNHVEVEDDGDTESMGDYPM